MNSDNSQFLSLDEEGVSLMWPDRFQAQSIIAFNIKHTPELILQAQVLILKVVCPAPEK